MLEKVLGDVSSWCWPYLVAKPSHTGVDVDGLAYLLYRPTTCSHQSRGYGFLSDAVWSHRAAAGGGTLPRDASLPGLDIC
jgi:hypothetical protein